MVAPTGSRLPRATRVRVIVLVLFVAAAVSVGLLLPPLDVDGIRASFAEFGWAGPVVFAVVYGLLTLSPLPKNVLSIAAGVVWGFGIAVVAVYAGALLGAGIAFALARLLGRDAVARLIGRRAAAVDDLFTRRGFTAILGLRLVPLVPFTALNYASGLTGVPFARYAAATAIGIIPGTAAYVALGAFGVETGPLFWVALGALGILILLGALAAVVIGRRRRSATAGAASESDARSEQPLDADPGDDRA